MANQFNKFIPALIGAIGGLIGNKMQQDSQTQANAQNERLMRESWERDDSSIQRKVADLKAAGLHPTLASGGGMSSSPVRLEPTIKENPVDQMIQSAQRSADIRMSKIQQAIANQQLAKENANARIEQKKAEIFEKTGVLPGQEPGFMGIKVPAGWYEGINKRIKEADKKVKGAERVFKPEMS